MLVWWFKPTGYSTTGFD